MRKILVVVLMVSLFSLSSRLWAANYSDPIDGVFKGIYGDTISIEVQSQVTKSPVDVNNQNGDLSFQINSNTGYKNFHQLTDLKYGDRVSVEYTSNPNSKEKQQMIASSITKLDSVANAVNTTTVADQTTTAVVVPHTVTTTTTTSVNQ